MWDIDFISQEQFDAHVETVIEAYRENIASVSVKEFNKNKVDSIKLMFDKYVNDVTWEHVINSEILRQRDKSNNNIIGSFHQQIFNYIADCSVPPQGWDVIFTPQGRIEIQDGLTVSTLFVEIKNKHNTLNADSGKALYKKMQDKILADDDCACLLVEAIATKSQNRNWIKTIDEKKKSHNRIRRVSIDKFYEIVTGDKRAFFQICDALPAAIGRVLENSHMTPSANDTVFSELRTIADEGETSIDVALYMLGFEGYLGFPESRRSS